MKRNLFLRLCLILTVMLSLYSCRNEDFANQDDHPKRNNADFFKHSKKGELNARSGIDYIDILQDYNRETNFLVTMPDQEGMPIWEKMKVFENESTTGLIIPLSHDDKTMSSVLFATLDNKNEITGVKDYDNNLLKDIVYNSEIDREFRERIFYTFMYMDNYTFGNEYFTNIPKDLFVGKKYDEVNGRIKFKDFTISPDALPVTSDETGKILVITSCASGWSCKNHESWSNCDHCPACYSTSCSTIMIYTADDSSYPPSTGGGGGGGGGGGTPSPQPDPDPCTITTSNAFYRLKPGCGGGNLPILDDPCKKTKASITTANTILKNPTVQSQMDVVLKGKTQAPNEWGVAIGQATNGYEVTNAVEGIPGQNQVSSPVSQLTTPFIGDGHSHKGARGNPSGGDLYEMIKATLDHPGLTYRFVYGHSGGVPEVYAFVINDKALAQYFLTQYPENENCNNTNDDHSIKKGSPVGKEFYKAKNHYSEGRVENTSGENYEERTVAMAYILEKFNVGISIAKVDANGNLKKINASVEQITISNSGGAVKEGIKVSKCP